MEKENKQGKESKHHLMCEEMERKKMTIKDIFKSKLINRSRCSKQKRNGNDGDPKKSLEKSPKESFQLIHLSFYCLGLQGVR